MDKVGATKPHTLPTLEMLRRLSTKRTASCLNPNVECALGDVITILPGSTKSFRKEIWF